MTVKEKFPHISLGYLFEKSQSKKRGFWHDAHDLYEKSRNMPADILSPKEDRLLSKVQRMQVTALQNDNARAGIPRDEMPDMAFFEERHDRNHKF